MIAYLILLANHHDGSTLQWITEWLEEWGDAVTISEGTTDKRGNEIILLEFDLEEDVPNADFYQALKDDKHITDYIVYSTEEDD